MERRCWNCVPEKMYDPPRVCKDLPRFTANRSAKMYPAC